MRSAFPLDAIDLKLLRLVQRVATIPLAQMADAAGLSSTPCWRRIQRLKGGGGITRHCRSGWLTGTSERRTPVSHGK